MLALLLWTHNKDEWHLHMLAGLNFSAYGLEKQEMQFFNG